MRRSTIAVVFALAFLAGFLCCGLVSNWACIRSTFYSVKITDLIQIITLILIAFFVTRYVNIRTNEDMRRRDVILDLVSKFQRSIENIYNYGIPYFEPEKREKSSEAIILANFTCAGNFLNLIDSIKNKKKIRELNNFDCNNFKSKFFLLKKALTDSPFKTDAAYSPTQIRAFNKEYMEILEGIYQYKADLETLH